MTEASPSLPPSQRDVNERNENENEGTLNNNDPPTSETHNIPFDSQNFDPETQPNERLQQELESEDTRLRQLHQEVMKSLI